ncbi:MFS transporter [Actinosynnema sp. NPDC020468]|uniref:MFS transporter n=1 Tax=Actinosynnema sp. NPDC020468 TaxID=3154488 RepID=UPI0033E14CC7
MGRGTWEPLRHREFRVFATGRLVSVLGNGVAPIALAFAVLDLTGSALDLGVVLAARTAASLVFLLFGGAVADRLPRGRVLVWSAVLATGSQAVAAGALLTTSPPVWWLVVLEAVNGAAAAFTLPATQGLMPQLVPKGLLRQANALFGLANNSTRIGGVALGGLLVATVGSGWAIAVDAATFAVSAVLFARLRLPAAARVSSGLFASLRGGWTEFASRRWLWAVVAAATVTNAMYSGGWSTLGPVIADGSFGRGWWGAVLASTTVGLVVGAAATMRFHPRRPLLVGVLGLTAYGPLLVLLALVPQPLVLAAMAFATGVGIGVFDVVWHTALQQNVPEDVLSRVVSYDLFGSFAALPLGQVAAGFLAERFAPAHVVLAAAALSAVAVAAVLCVREVRELGVSAESHSG